MSGKAGCQRRVILSRIRPSLSSIQPHDVGRSKHLAGNAGMRRLREASDELANLPGPAPFSFLRFRQTTFQGSD